VGGARMNTGNRSNDSVRADATLVRPRDSLDMTGATAPGNADDATRIMSPRPQTLRPAQSTQTTQPGQFAQPSRRAPLRAELGDFLSGVANPLVRAANPLLLLAVQLRAGMITFGWSALGVLVFLFALTVKERSYRLAGLGLLMLGVGKIIFVDIWNASPSDRYITLIVMGAALLLVSFLYSRYRETLLKFL